MSTKTPLDLDKLEQETQKFLALTETLGPEEHTQHLELMLRLITEARVARELEAVVREINAKHNFDDEEDDEGYTEGDWLIFKALSRIAAMRGGG